MGERGTTDTWVVRRERRNTAALRISCEPLRFRGYSARDVRGWFIWGYFCINGRELRARAPGENENTGRYNELRRVSIM